VSRSTAAGCSRRGRRRLKPLPGRHEIVDLQATIHRYIEEHNADPKAFV
jgi:hypothetical protein